MKRSDLPSTIAIVLLVAIASCAIPEANRSNTQAGGQVASESSAAPEKTTAEATPTPVAQTKDPKTVAVEFYEYYVDGFPSVQDEKPAFAKFLTSKFLGQALKADDYDPFLDAQDMDETWKGNVSASTAKTAGNKSSVDVLLKGETFKWTMRVSLVKQGSAWKIDGVKNITANEND